MDTSQNQSSMRLARAAITLWHHAILCDSTHQPQMARVMWQKYAEAANTVTDGRLS